MSDPPGLHHVVFAVARERHNTVGELFTQLGFHFDDVSLDELGLRVLLDWSRGIELISPHPGSTATVATSVRDFLASRGDGVFTVVLQVPGASAAESIAQRYGSTTRFRQAFSGDGNYLEEIDLSVFGLPLTFLSTNLD